MGQCKVQKEAWSVRRKNLVEERLKKTRRWLDFSERKMKARVWGLNLVNEEEKRVNLWRIMKG